MVLGGVGSVLDGEVSFGRKRKQKVMDEDEVYIFFLQKHLS